MENLESPNSYSSDKKPYRFNKQILSKSDLRKKMTFKRSPQEKFLYVSLAMKSSKSPTCEDRIILRKMRLDKGGVVDLAQEEMKKKGYKIKKIKQMRSVKRTVVQVNPKFRDKAARIIQLWWKGIKEQYKDELQKIIFIQSVWRGTWVRKYIYDMIYLNFLYVSFCGLIQKAMEKAKKRISFYKIMYHIIEDYNGYEEENYPEEGQDENVNYKDKQDQQDKLQPRNDEAYEKYKNKVLQDLVKIIELRKQKELQDCLKRWKQICWIMNRKENACKKFFDIRNEQEAMKVKLNKYFIKWAYMAKLLALKEEMESKQNVPTNIEDYYKIKGQYDQMWKEQPKSDEEEKINDYVNTKLFYDNFDKRVTPELAQFFKKDAPQVYDIKGQPIKGDLVEYIKKKGDIYDKDGKKIEISPEELGAKEEEVFDDKGRPIKQDLIEYIKNSKTTKPDVYTNQRKSLKPVLEDLIRIKADVNTIVKPPRQSVYDQQGREIKGDVLEYVKKNNDIYDAKGNEIQIDTNKNGVGFTDVFDADGNPIREDLVQFIKTKGDVYDIQGQPVDIDLKLYGITLNDVFDVNGRPITGDLIQYIKREGDVYDKDGKPINVDLTNYIKPPKFDLYDIKGKPIANDLVQYIKNNGDAYDIQGNKVDLNLEDYGINKNEVYDVKRRPIKGDIIQHIKAKGDIYNKDGKKISIDLDKIAEEEMEKKLRDQTEIPDEDNFYDKEGNKIQGDIIEYIKTKGDVYNLQGKPMQEGELLDKAGLTKGDIYDKKGKPIRGSVLDFIKSKGEVYDDQMQPIKIDLMELTKKPTPPKVYDAEGKEIKGDLVQYIKKGGDVYNAQGKVNEPNLEEYGIVRDDVRDYRGRPIRGSLIDYIRTKGDIYDLNKKPIKIDLDTIQSQPAGTPLVAYDKKGNKIEGDLVEYIRTKGDIYNIKGQPIKIDLDLRRKTINNFYDEKGRPIKQDLVEYVKKNGDVYDVKGNKLEIDLNKYGMTFHDTFDIKGQPIKGDLVQYIKTNGDVYNKEGQPIKVDLVELYNKPAEGGSQVSTLKKGTYFDANGNPIEGDVIQYVKKYGDVYDVYKKPIKVDLKEYKKYLPDVYDEQGNVIRGDLMEFIKTKGDVYDINGKKIMGDVEDYKTTRTDIYDKNGRLISNDLIEYIRRDGEFFDEKGKLIEEDLIKYIKTDGKVYNHRGKLITGSVINYLKNNKDKNLYDVYNKQIKDDLVTYVKNNRDIYDSEGNKLITDLLDYVKTNKADLYNKNNEVINTEIDDYIRDKNGDDVFDKQNKPIRGSIINYIKTKGDVYDKEKNVIKLDKEEYEKVRGDIYDINHKEITNDLLNYVKTNGDIYDMNHKEMTNDLLNYVTRTVKNEDINGNLYDKNGRIIKQDLLTYIKKGNAIYNKDGNEVKVDLKDFRKSMCDVYDQEGRSITNDLVTLIRNNDNVYDKYGRKINADVIDYLKTKGEVYDAKGRPIKEDLINYIKTKGNVYDGERKEIKVNADEFKTTCTEPYDKKGNLIDGDLVNYLRTKGDIYDLNNKIIDSELENIIRTKGDLYDIDGQPIKNDLLTYIKKDGDIYNYEGNPIVTDIDGFKNNMKETYDEKGEPSQGDIMQFIRNKGDLYDKNYHLLNDDLEIYIRTKAGSDLLNRKPGTTVSGTKKKPEKEEPEKDDYIKYLISQNKKDKLKGLLRLIDKIKQRRLRQAFYTWLKNALNDKNLELVNNLNELNNDNDDSKLNKGKIDNMRNNIFKTLIDNIDRKKRTNLLRKYFNKWYRNVIDMLKKEMKKADKEQRKSIKDMGDKLNLDLLLKESELKKLRQENEDMKSKADKDLLKIRKSQIEDEILKKKRAFDTMNDKMKACCLLERFCHRYPHKDPLNALEDKMNEVDKENKLKILIYLYDKSRLNILRIYFFIWRNKCKGLKQSELLIKMFATLLYIIRNYIRKKIIAKKFNTWRRNTHVMNSLLQDYLKAKSLMDIADVIRRSNIRQNGKRFLDNLKNTKGSYIIKKRLKDLYNLYKKKQNDLLKKYFDKWKNIANNEKLKLIKMKLLYTIYGKYNMNDRKNLLNKYFNKWHYNILKEDLENLKNKEPSVKQEEPAKPIVDKGETQSIVTAGLIRRRDKNDRIRRLRNALRKWNDVTKKSKEPILEAKPHLLKHNLLKNLNDFLDRLRKESLIKMKNLLLNKLIPLRKKLDKLKLLKYLLKWRDIARKLKAQDDLKKFRDKFMKFLLNRSDKKALMRAFNKWRFGIRIPVQEEPKEEPDKDLKEQPKVLPKVPYLVAMRLLRRYMIREPFKRFMKNWKLSDKEKLKEKGKPLADALDKIFVRDPLKRFLDNLKRNAINKLLKKLFPELFEKYRMKMLRKYFDKWRNLTDEFKNRKMKQIGQWLKNMLDKQKEQPKEEERKSEPVVATEPSPEDKTNRKNELLRLFLSKLINNDKYKLKLAFKYWSKITTNKTSDHNAKIIQEFCRGALYLIALDQFNDRQKLKKLLKYLYLKKLLKDLNDLGNKYNEPLSKAMKNMNDINKKYTLNDLLDFYKYPKKWNLLLKILKHKMGLDSKDQLRRAFNKWKNSKDTDLDKIIRIQTNIRRFLARKKLNALRNLNKVLLKLYNKHNKTDIDILKFRLRKWLQRCKEMENQENAQIIQKFIRNNMYNLQDKRLLSFFGKNNCRKLIGKKLLALAKLNKLKNAIMRHPYNTLMDQLKGNNKKKKFVTFIIKKTSFLDTKYKDECKRKYLKRWRDIANKLRERENEAIRRIQAAIRGYLYRIKFFRRKKLMEILLKMFLRKDNTALQLPAAFYKWVNIIKIMDANDNTKVIQKFCRGILGDYLEKLKACQGDGMKKLAFILGKLRPNLSCVMDKLKERQKLSKFKDFLDKLNDKRKAILKDAFDSIKEYPKIKRLENLRKLLDPYRFNKLRNALHKWKNNALNNKFIDSFLNKILKRYGDDLDKNLKSALRKWALNAKNIYQKEQADIIADFCKRNLLIYLTIQNWHKLANKLRDKSGNNEQMRILSRLRQYFGLEKLKKPIVRHARKYVIDQLLHNKYYRMFLEKLKRLIDKLGGNNDNALLNKYFDRWKNNTKRINEKEKQLKNFLDVLDKRHKVISSDVYNFVSLLKKLLHDIPLCQAKIAFDKLKNYGNKRNKFNKIAEDLPKDNEDLKQKQKPKILDKIYRLYYYKILDNLVKKLQKQRYDKARPALRKLINNLRNNLLTDTDYVYKSPKEGDLMPKKTKLTFNPNKTGGQGGDEDKQKKSKDKSKAPGSDKFRDLTLIPYLTKLLDKLRRRRLRDALDNIKNGAVANSFCKLYKQHNNKKILPPKKDLINYLRDQILGRRLKNDAYENLKKMLRHYFVNLIKDAILEHVPLMKLYYLIKVTLLHRGILQQRLIRTIIRKWRFITFVKIMSKRKLELMYKNMHISYLEMAKEMFGDDNSLNPSIIKEFQRFGDGVGMWTNEDPHIMNEVGWVKKVTKKYVFEKPYVKKRASRLDDNMINNLNTINNNMDINTNTNQRLSRGFSRGGNMVTGNSNNDDDNNNDNAKPTSSIETGSRPSGLHRTFGNRIKKNRYASTGKE